jgi:ligand-binding SRPBCC domain-containing protein
MIYTHKFTVNAPLEDVRAFHSQSASMGAITPPPVVVRVHRAPEWLDEGDEMEFTMWLGPMPIRWLARIEQVTPVSFVDRQLSGPFTQWVHTHTFEPVDAHTTIVHDRVEAETSSHWWWKLVGTGMWLNMPVLFGFRQWKTKRLLEATAREPLSA